MSFFGCESKVALYEMMRILQPVTLMEALQICSRLLGNSERTHTASRALSLSLSLTHAGKEIAWVEWTTSPWQRQTSQLNAGQDGSKVEGLISNDCNLQVGVHEPTKLFITYTWNQSMRLLIYQIIQKCCFCTHFNVISRTWSNLLFIFYLLVRAKFSLCSSLLMELTISLTTAPATTIYAVIKWLNVYIYICII